MAHPEQLAFFSQLKRLYPQFFQQVTVGEIGSLNINGTLRGLFSDCHYTGYDLDVGPGVDEVMPGQLVGLPTGHFDTLVSAECLEHNPFWVETFANMLRLSKPGGLIAFSCASTGRPEHGTALRSPNLSPLTHAKGWDYYRNLDAENFLNTFHLQGWFDYFDFMYCPRMFDLYFYGFRKGGTQEIRVEPTQMLVALNQQIQAVRLVCWAPALGMQRG